MVYHSKLGTQGERVERVRASREAIGRAARRRRRWRSADRAAQLAKADLLTDMVGEFPELQGMMGGYYARHDGLSRDVADAIEDHYKPRFAGDALPRNEVGVVVALADKLETLVGLFGIGKLPTGDKDPFALRRHALGVVRMLVERDLPLHFDACWTQACVMPSARRAGDVPTDARELRFLIERLNGCLREAGYRVQEVDAGAARNRSGSAISEATGGSARLRARCPRRQPGRGQQAHRQHPEEVGRMADAHVTSPAAGARRKGAPSAMQQRRAARPTRVRRRRLHRHRCKPWPRCGAGRCLLRRRDGQRRPDPTCGSTASAC